MEGVELGRGAVVPPLAGPGVRGSRAGGDGAGTHNI